MNPHLGTCRPEPGYVERGGEIAFRPPFRSSGACVHYFFVEADESRLGRYLDRCFNQASDGAVSLRPAGPYVLLNFVEVDRLSSGPPDSALGGVAEKEAAIWLPALEKRRGPDRLVWTVPFMYVDSGQALASGREIYGYPKQLGKIKARLLDDGTPDRFSVHTLALRRHRPEAMAKRRRVLKVERVGLHQPSEHATYPDRERARDGLRELLPDEAEVVRFVRRVLAAGEESREPHPGKQSAIEAVRNSADLAEIAVRLWTDLFDRDLTMFLLKQFRSATDPQRACYQAILEVSHRLAEVRGWTLHADEYEVTFDALASQHIQEELGVSTDTKRAVMAVTLDFDFEVMPGKVLWQAALD